MPIGQLVIILHIDSLATNITIPAPHIGLDSIHPGLMTTWQSPRGPGLPQLADAGDHALGAVAPVALPVLEHLLSSLGCQQARAALGGGDWTGDGSVAADARLGLA